MGGEKEVGVEINEDTVKVGKIEKEVERDKVIVKEAENEVEKEVV